jgi:MoxR-like ATPase
MVNVEYKKAFDPKPVERFDTSGKRAWSRAGDRRDGSVYVYSDEIVLRVNVALATGRPLLVRGPAGSGKSSLAANVARHMGWRYYEDVISSRTQARDLLWTFDTVRRLNDAQAEHKLNPVSAYVQPGVLWWAFNSQSARAQRLLLDDAGDIQANRYGEAMDTQRAVVLLDEIDKADPDVPNNLLVPVGSYEFQVTETGTKIQLADTGPPVLFITTNDERELPAAFLRRCVVLELKPPADDKDYEDWLVKIAQAHFGTKNLKLYGTLARRIRESRNADGQPPSTAEYLDAVQACQTLGVTTPAHAAWAAIVDATLFKPRGPAADLL